MKRQHRRSEDRKALQRFLALGTAAITYHQGLQQRSLNELSHIRKILALSEYHDRTSVLRALKDATVHGAFNADYIANLLQFRSCAEEPSPLHLPGKQELLDIEITDPNFDIYDERLDRDRKTPQQHPEEDYTDGLY